MRKKKLTVQEFATLGGKAKAKKMSKAERSEHAKKMLAARWKKKKTRNSD